MTKACLLLGNGINRCCGGLSWEDLLQKIAHKYFASSDNISSSTLAFEQLKCTVLSRNIKLQSDEFAFEILAELDNLQQDKYNGSIYFSENFHSTISSSSSPENLCMIAMQTEISIRSPRAIAAPRYGLYACLNCCSIISPIMTSEIPPSFLEI